VAINDVLPLMAAQRDAIANLKCFLVPRDTNSLMSMVSFTSTMRRHLIRLVYLRRVGEISVPILRRLWTKVHEIFRRCMRPFVFSNALADWLYHVSFRRYSPL